MRQHPRRAAIEPVMVSVNEAAQALGIGRSTLYNLIASGQLQTVKVGGRRLVPYEPLLRFCETLNRAAGAQEDQSERPRLQVGGRPER